VAHRPPGRARQPAFRTGNHLVTADVSDAAGNPAPEATRTISVDTHAPSVTISAIAGNDVVNAAEGAGVITVSGTAAGGRRWSSRHAGVEDAGWFGHAADADRRGERRSLEPRSAAGRDAGVPDGHISSPPMSPTRPEIRPGSDADDHGRHRTPPSVTINTIAGNDVVNGAEGAGVITVSARRRARRTGNSSRSR